MKKKYGCLVLAACLFACSVLTAHAVEQQGKSGWKAEFTGKAVESNFSSRSMAEEISGLQPGDSVELNIAVVNASDRGADWYMSNEVLQSLEDKSPAKGGAYRYELTYKGSGNPMVIYSSNQVGGESSTKGLHEAANSLEKFFYLDYLDKGEKGNITLRVSLDEETQGNDYQNTLARLQLNFAVEGRADGSGGGGGSGGSNGNNGSGSNGNSSVNNGSSSGGGSLRTPGPAAVYTVRAVRTGDTGDIVLWSVIAMVSGLALAVVALICQKKSREEQKDD